MNKLGRYFANSALGLAALGGAGCSEDIKVFPKDIQPEDIMMEVGVYLLLGPKKSEQQQNFERWEDAKFNDKIHSLYEPLYGRDDEMRKIFPGTADFKTSQELREEAERVDKLYKERDRRYRETLRWYEENEEAYLESIRAYKENKKKSSE